MKKYLIAIVGGGPAGYFTAQALQNAQTDDLTFQIDMIERLPTPWGLVRSGVAPDHPKIKTVAKVFEKIATEPNFRLFANVEVGKDVSIKVSLIIGPTLAGTLLGVGAHWLWLAGLITGLLILSAIASKLKLPDRPITK
jgi:NADPH-dependent glutamate synthase beta subunit-like oxidoreductase